MNVEEIVGKWLVENGFDGLFNADGECACEIGDIAPCCEISGDCQAGHRVPCPEDCGEHSWHIVRRENTEVA